MRKIIEIGLAVLMVGSAEGRVALVPWPQKVVLGEGVYRLSSDSVAKSDVDWRSDAAIPAEGYRLSVCPAAITVWSSDESGGFYALQTLRQLARGREIPSVEIEDAPRFRHRGYMLDDARHFLGKELVKRYLDLMSEVKMNVFHWHLTDDEGWRLELKRHPEVHLKGSVRPQSMNHGATEENPSWNGERYGPYYYTHEDVREIVAYAAERRIQVIPEIDLPAHSRAVFVSHPEFTCIGTNETFRYPWMKIGPQYECYCAANEEAMRFLEDVLDEVCELFPSRQIHIGGDECPPNRWQECRKCRALMDRLGIERRDAGKLQTRMLRRFARFLAARGREAVAWDEVLADNMPTNIVMQLWRDPRDGRRAAAAGVDVVMSPCAWTYFSRSQGLVDDPIQYNGNAVITLEKAFGFNPVEGFSPDEAARVRGVECCCWGEMTWGWFDCNWKMWPRSFAFAEVAWSGPGRTEYADFLARVRPLHRRLLGSFVNPAPLPER